MNKSSLVTPLLLLSLSLCAAPAMATETIAAYASTTASLSLSNSVERGALHHSASISAVDEAVSIAKSISGISGISGDSTPWQASSSYQNPVFSSAAAASLAAPLSAGLNPFAAAATLNTLPATANEKSPHRGVAAKLSQFDTSAISQPGIYTMILIGIGLLSLRSRRKLAQDEKFAA
jgi:hypothetical protein